MRKLTAIDLFAGAGGFSLAAINTGVEIKAGVELNPLACRTYKKNIVARSPRTVLHEGDIREVDWQALLQKVELRPGDCDILLGGPPCQGFSTHRIKGTGIGDPRNELLLEYFKAIACIRPKIFLVENVAGLLWPRHASYLSAFSNKAETAGYKLHSPTLLNARDFGVPQNRKRVFILGVRADLTLPLTWPPTPTHFPPDMALSGKPRWLTAATVFASAIPSDDPNNIHMKHSNQLVEVFKKTPKNGGSRCDSGRVLQCHREHDGHKDVYGRIDPAKPGPTITTGCINPSKGRFVHPTKNHAITARHAARFQGFPDWFVFEGGLIAAGTQIGNAVPVPLGEALIDRLAACLKKNRRSEARESGKKAQKDQSCCSDSPLNLRSQNRARAPLAGELRA